MNSSDAPLSEPNPTLDVLATIHGPTITRIRVLSADEAGLALDAIRRLDRCHDETQIMLLPMMNVQAFEVAYDGYVDEVRRGGGMGPDRLSFVALDLNRLLLNSLASFNMFLDHANIDVVRRFGDESTEHKRFTDRRRTLYDSVFAYRFCYHLRDYAVHCGMPLQTFSAEARLSADAQAIEVSLEVGVNPDHLLERFDWKKGIRGEIAMLGVLDVKAILRDAIECVTNLMALKNEIIGDDVLAPLLVLESLERECAVYPGTPHLLSSDFMAVPGASNGYRQFPIVIMRSVRAGLEAA